MIDKCFPGCPVVESSPVNMGDMGLILGLGDAAVGGGNPCCAQMLNLCTTSTESHVPRAHVPQQEKPSQSEKPAHCNEDPA